MFEDLKLKDIADTEKCYICHPSTGEVITDKEGNKAWIEVYPKDSVVGRRAERRILDKRLKSKSKTVTTADFNDTTVEMLTALTKDWYLVRGDGEPAEYSCDEETKREFYSDDSLRWIRDQVDMFVLDIDNFFKG